MMQRISVCGVAKRNNLYLIAQRNNVGSQGGKWEFPGGKCEKSETPAEALEREFQEELKIKILVKEHFFTGLFSNGKKEFQLQAWRIELNDTLFVLTEHQQVVWLPLLEILKQDLSDSDRLVANALFLEEKEKSS